MPPPTCAVSPVDGSVVNCTGDQSVGVVLNDGSGPFRTLNVFALTTNIAPASGATGVEFTSDGDVALNVDAGAFGISTTGDNASGLFAGSDNGDVAIRSFANIITTGNLSHGIAANSDGGTITITSVGNIATEGLDAIGINATSQNGSIVITSLGNIATASDGSAAINAMTDGNVTITSIGNLASLGEMPSGTPFPVGLINGWSANGDVTITAIGNLATTGNYAVGISAAADGQALVGALGSITTLGFSAAGISVIADAARVESLANISTQGIVAPGIVVDVAGDATIISRGNITTTGVGADGILAISGGTANITNYGNITAAAYGISAQGDGGNTVLNFGIIQGCPCAGVDLLSTAVNQLTNFGAIIAAPGGNAIESIGDINTVDNYGVITGNVLMSGVSSSVFDNRAGALFNSGDTVIADVSNAGTLAPGGTGTVETTIMTGALTQSASGIFAVDVDGALADRMNVSSTADLAGTVNVNFLSLPALTTYTILQAGSLTDNGLGLIASPALHAQLQFNGNDLDLVFAIDFATDRLNPNQRAIAADLNQIFLAGGGGVTPVLLGLLNTGSFDAYKNALNQLSPEIYSNAEIAALYSSLAFSNSLLSCKVNGTGTAAIIREGQCLWAGASANFLDTGTTSDQIGFTQTTGLFNAGAQVALDDVWRVGFGAGYQSSSLQTATNAQSDGSLAQAGLSVKYNPGPLLLAGAVSGGGAWYDTTRTMAFGGFTGVAEGDQDVGIVSGSLRAAYVLGSPHLYYKPILDLGLTHLELGGFTESGGGGAALTVAGGGQTVFSLAPTLEVGSEWWMSNGTLIRPMIRGGAIWYDGADFALTAAFAGAPLGVSPFTINTNIDEVMGLVGAGVEVINGGDAALRFSYDGQLGETTQIHTVGVKGSARF